MCTMYTPWRAAASGLDTDGRDDRSLVVEAADERSRNGVGEPDAVRGAKEVASLAQGASVDARDDGLVAAAADGSGGGSVQGEVDVVALQAMESSVADGGQGAPNGSVEEEVGWVGGGGVSLQGVELATRP